jgi:hypothetical protein
MHQLPFSLEHIVSVAYVMIYLSRNVITVHYTRRVPK